MLMSVARAHVGTGRLLHTRAMPVHTHRRISFMHSRKQPWNQKTPGLSPSYLTLIWFDPPSKASPLIYFSYIIYSIVHPDIADRAPARAMAIAIHRTMEPSLAHAHRSER